MGKAPVAVCGLDLNAAPFQTVSFDGSASYDPDGLPLTHAWTLAPPSGSPSALSGADGPQPTLLLDVAGDYVATLTVTNTVGFEDSCDQTVSAVPETNLTIELTWSLADDLDLHLLEANDGTGAQGLPRTDGDCYYANCNTNSSRTTLPDWGVPGVTADNPGMDLDDIQGTGPEITSIIAPAGPPYDGLYQVMVHDYPGSVDEPAPNAATVRVYVNGVLLSTLNFSIEGEDSDYYVATIHWPSGAVVPCSGLSGCP